MIGVIQRAKQAHVDVQGECVGRIDAGLVVLLGIEAGDTQKSAETLLNKILNYRMFNDDNGRMNLSLKDTGGELLLVSQFTLVANTQKGLRPSFAQAAPPKQAQPLYDHAVAFARQHVTTATGIFGADMQVSLVNDGPVTFILQAN